jgi:hypothetical protein
LTPGRRLLHRLAETLGCSLEEVEAMRGRDVAEWLAYWQPAVKPAPTSLKDLFR